MKSDLFKMFQEHEHGRLIYPDGGDMISYCGPITQEFIDTIMLLIDSKLDDDWNASNKSRKLKMIVIELLQNIYHHSKKMNGIHDDMHLNSALCMIEKKDNDTFVLSAGNFVESDQIEELRNRMIEVNDLDKDQLKELYRKKLADAELSEKGGAGLGIIEIARKSSEKIEYDFKNITDNFAFLTVRVTV